MNAELHADNPGGNPNASARQTAKPESEPPHRSLAILIALGLIGLGMMILPRPTLYYPNVVIDVVGGMQLEFLLNGRQDKAACETDAASIANVFTASCRECRTRSHTCIKNPPAELRQRFDETPLPVPSARMADGIVTYSAPQADIALLACQESERQAALQGDQAKVTCYAAGATRPRTAFEKDQYQTAHTVFTLLLAVVGSLTASLIAAILITYTRQRRHLANPTIGPVGIPILPTHPWLQKLTLAGVDTLILLGTFLALAWPASDDINRWSRLDRASIIGHGVVVVLTIGWFWLLLEHYARRRPFWDELREIFRVLAVMFMVSSAAAFVAGLETGRSSHLIVWALNFLLIPLGRAGTRQLLDDLGLWQRPAVIIGTGENARDAYLAIKSERDMGYQVLGFARVGDGETANQETFTIGTETFPILENSRSLESMLTTLGKPQVILALDSLADSVHQSLVQRLLAAQTNLHIIPAIRGLPLFGTQLSHFFSQEVLFLTVRNNLSRRSVQWIKRGVDIVGASILLVILSPLMAYVAWRIWREDGSPVIFHQPRLAKGGGEFGFLKFRSMMKNADEILASWRENNSPEWQKYYANNFKLKNDPRVLRVGSWIRASSIDELPQLINVLRGEMSLVGPRPLLARELSEYGTSINYYRQARPGITGLWQISGRSSTKFSDRADLDAWYVQNWSLWYDIAILFKTVNVVFNRRGAY
jgi:Undecaprenyl-phosphate galactose phosphotransferase WbaP